MEVKIRILIEILEMKEVEEMKAYTYVLWTRKRLMSRMMMSKFSLNM